MPVSNNPALNAVLNRALSNQILSRREVNRIASGVTSDAEAAQVADVIKQALDGGGIDLSTDTRRRNLNTLLGTLVQDHHLPLDRGAATTPDGSVNWIGALRMAQGQDPIGDALPKRGLCGQRISVDDKGGLALGDQNVTIDLSKADATQLDALMALLPKGQLDTLSDNKKAALADTLLNGMGALSLPLDNEGKNKFKEAVGMVASLGALSRLGPALTGSQVDQLLALYEKAPNPMAKTLLLDALDQAPLSPAQTAAKAKLSAPENRALLSDTFNMLTGDRPRIGWSRPDGAAVQFALSALAFAKNQTGIDNVMDGMKVYKDLNRGGAVWDQEEISHMSGILEDYVNRYPQIAYVFGTFAQEAPKNLAKLTNARVVQQLTPGLSASPPKFGQVPLTDAQASFMKTLIAGVKDEGAVADMERALADCNDIFSGQSHSRWSDAPTPTAPLPKAAFALFQKLAQKSFEQREGTSDGMIDAGALSERVSERAEAIKDSVGPQLRSLKMTPPRFGGVEVSADAAQKITALLRETLKSELTVENLAGALQIVTAKFGAPLEGAGLQKFEAILDAYQANWPGVTTLDYNKLPRIATFLVDDKPIPLCTVNGKQVGLADVYNQVGLAVSASLDKTLLKQPWMAQRWGVRAKESCELLDVIAQQTAEGAGPLKALEQQFPGRKITVLATGRDGAHEQFLFEVEGRGRFAQGSDGALKRYTGSVHPTLFSASVNADGSFDVAVPQPNRVRKYPLQTVYGVGDSIDVKYFDRSVTEDWNEGEAFHTQNKVLEGTITAYDADGTYTVKYTQPDGKEIEKQLSLGAIKKENNPHLFAPKGSYFSDVNIDIDTDQELAKFMEGLQPIIDKHLPQGDALVTMSRDELVKAQKAYIKEVMRHIHEVVKYPTDKDSNPDANSREYHKLTDGWGRFPLGEIVRLGKGVCRHQCILEHLALQAAGIDSRLASGAANTSSGTYRGLHIWVEVSLADNARYLSDQTWSDPLVPLWDGAYDSDQRRVEMYHRTARYADRVVD